MLCSRFLKSEASYGRPGRFYRASERVFNLVLGAYESGLKWVLRHQTFMLVVGAVTFLATLWLYTIVPKGFFPQQDTGMLFATVEAAQDISFPAMVKLQREAAGIILGDPAVETLGSFVGGGGGGGNTVNNGSIFITLKPLPNARCRRTRS